MTTDQAETSGQAAHRVHYQAVANGHLGTRPVPYDELGPMGENAWEDIGQAVIDAATEGSLRACGYTLADVGRFLEAEAAARQPQPAPGAAELLQLADDWEKLADENDDDGMRSGETEWNYRASELRSCAASLRTLAEDAR